jgi:carboxypeptidase family protein
MQLRSIVLTAAVLAVGARAGAQVVRVEVVDASTGKPIVGANVALLDSAAVIPLGGGFSDQGGGTELRAPSRGNYRVRADKVGYDTWTSVQLILGDQPIIVRATMTVSRNPAPIIPRSERACLQLTGPGTPAGDLWAELKKALTANAMTEAQGLVPLDVDLYERVLDRNLSIVSERAEQRNRIPRRPLTGISWDQIDTARRGQTSSDIYRAPDAATMLSDQFVKSHCFAAIRGYGPETGLMGLEFKPARVSPQPELAGVLWLDPKANALRSVNFDYVNLPIPLRIARTTGRVEFQQLAGGQWIVPSWYIRMPRVTRVTSNDVGLPATSRDSLIGYQEVGGAARPAGTPAPATTTSAQGALTPSASGGAVAPPASVGSLASPAPATAPDSAPAASPTVLTGLVYDSTSGRALGGVQVSTGGGRFKTTTNSAGRYQLLIDGALDDTLVFDHPRLRLLHIAERWQSISLPIGSRGQASVIVPSYATLRKRICGQNETGTDSQGFMAGYVRDASGIPVPRAHVWATWQILWVEQNGRLVAANQQRTVETDTGSDGSFMMCGFTHGAQITAKVGIAGRSTVQEKLVFPANMVLEHDFVLGPR